MQLFTRNKSNPMCANVIKHESSCMSDRIMAIPPQQRGRIFRRDGAASGSCVPGAGRPLARSERTLGARSQGKTVVGLLLCSHWARPKPHQADKQPTRLSLFQFEPVSAAPVMHEHLAADRLGRSPHQVHLHAEDRGCLS